MANSVRHLLVGQGWIALDSKTSSRAYKEKSGVTYGTLERDGVRVALSHACELVEERGCVYHYGSEEPGDLVLVAVIVDQGMRGKGLGGKAMRDVLQACDANGTTVYVEACPIEEGSVSMEALIAWYSRLGFSLREKSKRTMVRKPVQSCKKD